MFSLTIRAEQGKDTAGNPDYPPTKPTIAESPTAWLIKNQITDHIPADHMDLLVGIDFQEHQYIHGMTTLGVIDAYGVYRTQSRVISLSSNKDNIAVIGGGTVLHEVGHHVHLAKMTDAAALEWSKISEHGTHAMISAYARTNQGEHFAEAYRAYAKGGRDRAALKNLEPASYKFMAKVFKTNSKMLLPNGSLAHYNPARYSNT
jgi:hypothetical protein